MTPAEHAALAMVYEGPHSFIQYERSRGWRRLAWANTLALWVFVVLFTVLYSCGYAHAPRLNNASPPGDLVPEREQSDRVARLDVLCVGGDPFAGTTTFSDHYGSAVILDRNHLLTASHVADCAAGLVMVAQLADGRRIPAHLVRADHEHDIALLETRADLGAFKTVRIAAVSAGENVCEEPALPPLAQRECGFVTKVERTPVEGNDFGETAMVDVKTTMTVVPGNSGAGVWDSEGALVGVVTHTGGYVTSLWGMGMTP